MSEQIDIKKQITDKLENKEFVIYFYAPSINSPSGGMSVLFKQARILKDEGYNVKILFEPRVDERASYQASMKAQARLFIYEKFNPTWMDIDFSDIELLPQVAPDEKGNPTTKIKYTDNIEQEISATNINPEDFVIIPEGCSNIMQQLATSGCKKIVLAQSWIYILNSLQSGQTWDSFGIKDCMSISDTITNYIKSIMPTMNIKQYSQSIDRTLFNVPDKKSKKYPMVGYHASRGPENKMQTVNVIKNFQAWYPHYRWIRFVELSGLSKKEYAERLKECSLFLCTDQIAGWGSSAPEALAAGTTVVGWAAPGSTEYINAENGFWATNGDIFQLSEYLGIAVDKMLTGELDNKDIQASYERTLSRYTVEGEKESVLKIYQEYINDRINEIKQL